MANNYYDKHSLVLLAVAALVGVASSLSIEREPVRVTPLNSGPRYTVDEVERQPINKEAEQANNEVATRLTIPDAADPTALMFNPFRVASPTPSNENADQENQFPVLAVRRFIFITPRRNEASDGADSSEDSNQTPLVRASVMPMSVSPFSMFSERRPPFWLTPGNDDSPLESSRPQTDLNAESSGEAGKPFGPRQDPFQTMMELLHKVLESRVNGSSPFSVFPPRDLKNEESFTNGKEPTKPIITDESTSEIVEIDGEKFVKKTTIKKHIDHGMYLLTKKLSFVPLNETDASTITNATSTVAPVATDSSPVTTEINSNSKTEATTQTPSTTTEAVSSTTVEPRAASTVVTTTEQVTNAPAVATEPSTTTSTTTVASLEREDDPAVTAVSNDNKPDAEASAQLKVSSTTEKPTSTTEVPTAKPQN